MTAEPGVRLNTALSLLHRARSQIRQALNEHAQRPPDCTTVALDPNAPPSRQRWQYRPSYALLPAKPSEARVCQGRNGVLTIADAELYPDTAPTCPIWGVVDPYRPSVLRLRARRLREGTRYPECQVDGDSRRPCNRSFAVRIFACREARWLGGLSRPGAGVPDPHRRSVGVGR